MPAAQVLPKLGDPLQPVREALDAEAAEEEEQKDV
jgi:hypothetical protein